MSRFNFFMVLLFLLATNVVLASKNSVFKTIETLSPGAKQSELSPDHSLSYEAVPVDLKGKKFLVKARKHLMERQPCDLCHSGVKQGSLAQKAPTSRKAHWDLTLKHPSIAKDCNLCHDHKAELVSINKDPISFDHSYKLCAQCHGEQFKDWQGGAHGKRLGGWTGQRLIQNCTGCHNPHDPKFEQKRPAIHASQGTR